MKSLILIGLILVSAITATAGSSTSYVTWTVSGYCAEYGIGSGVFIQYHDRYVCQNPSAYGFSSTNSVGHSHHTTVVVKKVQVGYSADYAVALADMTIEAVNSLKPYETYGNLGAFLLPIRKTAARLKAIGNANSPYSQNVRQALIDLSSQLYQAKTYIDQKLEVDVLVDTAIQLMTVKEKIDALL